METTAIILEGAKKLSVGELGLNVPKSTDIVVETRFSGISSGTEKLLWTGEMPSFPGMGYPLVPGYESVGEIVEAGSDSGLSMGQTVFVPGANCYEGARGLFGAAARHLVTDASRVTRVDAALGAEGALLALAATARHAMAGLHNQLPDLIIGHGVLGRLFARLTLAAGGNAPTVWEIDPARRSGADGYSVIDPTLDERRNYRSVYDASGVSNILNKVIPHLAKGGEVVLAGFYSEPVQFAYPPAFMKEVRMRIAAEWTPDDLVATRDLIEGGHLNLSDLITHSSNPAQAGNAYSTAFSDAACLKMILDWEGTA
ncbi:MAG: chlorophyll synthesis pathway protein BchC [Pseudomonadota bacterium]